MTYLKSILFVMPNLGGAGAERVVSILLNNIDRSHFKPKLVILKKSGSNSFLNDLKDDVEVVSLGMEQRLRFSVFTLLIKLVVLIRKESPDILFMGAGTINAFFSAFLFLLPKKTKKVARESNLPSLFEKIKFIRWMYRKFYNNYDLIIAQSNDMAKDLIGNFMVNPLKIKKINNPVDIHFIQKKLSNDGHVDLPINKINLLAAGRLTYQKGFDLLIEEFSKIENKNYHLTILGEGEERSHLTNLVAELGVMDKISLKGNVHNPYIYMHNADIFVLSSRFEGFPNVLLESLVCGCKVLANKCPGGIDEIVNEYENGLTFSYENLNFAERLEQLLASNIDRAKISLDAKIKYSANRIVSKYMEILDSL